MADKAFGVKDINLIGASGTPTIESPNNLNINAVNVAISTDITVAGKVSLGAGTSISSPATNVLTLGTNSVERVRIDSSGNVGIQTNNPQSKLHIGNPVNTSSDIDTTNTSLIIKQSTNTREDGIYIERGGERKGYYMWLNPGGGAGDGLTFSRNSSGTYSNALILDRDANAHFGGNAVFASGNGIDFSATANGSGTTDSELLNDYEEGTWQPYISGATSGSVTSFNERHGYYTRVGELVVASFYITNPGTNSGVTGQWRIDGLPFAAKNYGNYYGSGTMTYIRSISSTGWLSLSIRGDSSARTYAEILNNPNSTAETSQVSGTIATNLILRGNIIYSAA